MTTDKQEVETMRNHHAQRLAMVITGAPYDTRGERLGDVSGLRAADIQARGCLQAGQSVTAYVLASYLRGEREPLARWVCSTDDGGCVRRVNV
jgi:hypothetical protein